MGLLSHFINFVCPRFQSEKYLCKMFFSPRSMMLNKNCLSSSRDRSSFCFPIAILMMEWCERHCTVIHEFVNNSSLLLPSDDFELCAKLILSLCTWLWCVWSNKKDVSSAVFVVKWKCYLFPFNRRSCNVRRSIQLMIFGSNKIP